MKLVIEIDKKYVKSVSGLIALALGEEKEDDVNEISDFLAGQEQYEADWEVLKQIYKPEDKQKLSLAIAGLAITQEIIKRDLADQFNKAMMR